MGSEPTRKPMGMGEAAHLLAAVYLGGDWWSVDGKAVTTKQMIAMAEEMG